GLDADNVGTGFFRKKVAFVQASRSLLKDFFGARKIRLDNPRAELQVIRKIAPGLARLDGNMARAARDEFARPRLDQIAPVVWVVVEAHRCLHPERSREWVAPQIRAHRLVPELSKARPLHPTGGPSGLRV